MRKKGLVTRKDLGSASGGGPDEGGGGADGGAGGGGEAGGLVSEETSAPRRTNKRVVGARSVGSVSRRGVVPVPAKVQRRQGGNTYC